MVGEEGYGGRAAMRPAAMLEMRFAFSARGFDLRTLNPASFAGD